MEGIGEGAIVAAINERHEIWKSNGFRQNSNKHDNDFRRLEGSWRSLNWAADGALYLP